MKVLRRHNDYKIVMEGEDFTMYKGEEMLITSMSLDKVDRFWDDLMMVSNA